MFSPFERLVAFRYLRSRRAEGFVSVITAFSLIGIALGVATLIVVMSVMNGFREELLTRILGLNGHMTVKAVSAEGITDYGGLAMQLEDVEGVVSATPIIEGQVMATVRGAATGAIVRGIDGSDLANIKILAGNITRGSIEVFKAGEGILIGDRMARRLGLDPGDKLGLISPESTATAFGSVPRARNYTVAATFEIGMYEYDSGFIFMPLGLAQVHFKLKGAASAIELMTIDADSVGALRGPVRDSAGPATRVVDWRQQHAHFFNALQVERNVMFVILALIVLVAAFNIIAGLIMVVKDKGRDIAILRTMGATRGQVMRIFFMNGAAIGVAGTLLGVGLGLAFATNIDAIRLWIESLSGAELFAPEIRFLSQLPAKIDGGEVAAIVGMALGLSFLATLYPAFRAARLDPVEALRYE